MEKQELCQKCGEPHGKSAHESLCQKCIKSLPQCYSCGIVCGAEEWGYDVEKEAILCILKKNGKNINLCGSCIRVIFIRGYLESDIHGKILADEIEIPSMKPSQ